MKWSFDIDGALSGCSFCFKNKKRCDYQLTRLYDYWLSLPLAKLPLVSTLSTGRAIPSHAAKGLSVLSFRPAVEQTSVTQGQQTVRQEQYHNRSPIDGQSLYNVAGWDVCRPRTVPSRRIGRTAASSRTGKPLYPPGSTSYTQPRVSQQHPLGTSLCFSYFLSFETLLTQSRPSYRRTQLMRRGQN